MGIIMITGIDCITTARETILEELDMRQGYGEGRLADAASCYAANPEPIEHSLYDGDDPSVIGSFRIDRTLRWPFGSIYWKPKPHDRVKELSKAGALIAAEIDRLLSIK